jgi:hypothetical protein
MMLVRKRAAKLLSAIAPALAAVLLATLVRPGQATGQGIDLNGGDWYLMQPSGKPLSEGLPA